VGFQDTAYGAEYLDRLARVQAADSAALGWELTRQGAKYIANAMAYDDVIRVADEKTRAARMARIRAEMGGAAVVQVTDYTHPRAEEVVSLLPAPLARWINARPRLLGWIDRRVNRGRRLRTDRLGPYLQLYLLAGLRGWRRRSLRHAQETAHLDRWLATVLTRAATDPAQAVELIKARRLIKGYSDTHARGLSKFDRVMAGADLVAGRPDAADWTRRLITAALADEEGRALDGAIETIRSFQGTQPSPGT
jgi:indolepyruvate ferredoxin oxidoreductase, beta subunit